MIIVVTGATGNVGRPLVSALVDAGVQVRAVTRNPATAGFPARVKVLQSTAEALPGATAVFLNSRALIGELPETTELAARSGVGKLVALSALNADDDFSRQPSRFRGDRNKEVEQLAVDSGLEWVSLRPSVFVTNFVGMWANQIRSGDLVNGPYASASTSPVVESDIAAVAARALLSDDLVGQKIPLTGPQALTNTQLLAIIAEVLNRPLRYQEVPADAVRQRFIGIGLPAEFADAYTELLAEAVGTPALVTHEVEKILGRPAETFAHWVAQRPELFG